MAAALSCGLIWATAYAQELNPTADPQTQQQNIPNGGKPIGELHGVPLYRVSVVQRDLDAVNYLHRSGATKIAFKGTPLLPGAKGEARVQSQKGRIDIDASFDGLTPANGFGNEYLTYVLWAISPEGTPENLGEILPAGKSLSIKVSTSMQAFGMIVTAEPYFAVKVPSNIVVLENQIIQDKTTGVLEKVNAHYSLLPRGAYAQTSGSKTVLDPITRDEHTPLELYEAHNAFRIAQLAGAEKYAPDIMAKTRTNIQNADDMNQNKKRDVKMLITYARGAVQSAEDARIVTLRKKAAEERQAAIDARHAAELQAAQSQAAAAQAELQRQRAEAEAQRAAAAQADADAQRRAAEQSAADAERRVHEMRERLRAQLNAILVTTETPRGLMVNLADVLFDTGKYTLKENAKLSLAKVAVIIAATHDLKLQVEGYTDSVGSDNYNQKLSENRADTVKNFLIAQGVDPANISATGYGKSHPVADNSTAEGRSKNRRVQLIVSGPSIGYTTQQQPTE